MADNCCSTGGAGGGSDVPNGARDGNDINQGSEDLGHTIVDLSRSPCSSDRAVVQVFQGQPAILKLYVADRNGTAVNLDDLPSTAEIRYVVKDREVSNSARFGVTCTIEDAENGVVRCELTKSNTRDAGIFVAQVIVTNSEGATLWTTPYWHVSNITLEGWHNSGGPPTIPEIRLIMRDACPEQNTLLNDLEFDDSQIVACLRLPIDEFNEKYQPKTNYSPRTFPFRFHWMRATAGYLLEIAGRGYMRDHLPYNAGGVSVDDKNKASQYIQAGQMLLAEWRQFVKERKIEMNIEGAYGRLGSYYGYTNW